MGYLLYTPFVWSKSTAFHVEAIPINGPRVYERLTALHDIFGVLGVREYSNLLTPDMSLLSITIMLLSRL